MNETKALKKESLALMMNEAEGTHQTTTADFTELYRRNATNVFYYLYSRVRNVADAEDLASQTFLTALENLPKLRDPLKFTPWVFTIARNKAFDFFRKAQRRPTVDFDEYEQPFNPVLYDANGRELPVPDHETQLELWEYEDSLRNQLSDQEGLLYDSTLHTFVVPKSGILYPVYARQNVYERTFPEKEAYVDVEFDGSKVQASDEPVEINREIQIGSVKFTLNAIGKNQFGGYSFLFDGTEGNVVQCQAGLVGYTTNMGGSSSFNPDDPFHFKQAEMYSQIPTGMLTVRVSQPAVLGERISFIGSWSPEK